jgi:hypothetical protein
VAASFRASTEPLRKPYDVAFAEDNCFVAIVPQLAGCSAVGSSKEEAVREGAGRDHHLDRRGQEGGEPCANATILARAEQALT